MDYLKDFGLDNSFNTVQIKNAKEKPEEYLAISESIATLLDQSPFLLIGSNSWVIGEKKPKAEKFNDPHISFHNLGPGMKRIW
jgi:penicillin amidase